MKRSKHWRSQTHARNYSEAMGSHSTQEKEAFMRQALELSREALPTCRPNPPVGCIIEKNGIVVAEGFTQTPGQPHAEAAALHAYKDSLQDASVFVTLEPCSFIGRTPSCAQTLIDRGARQVFVAIEDPHPKNQGRGIAMLRAAGVQVETGLLASEVNAFLHPYLIRDDS